MGFKIDMSKVGTATTTLESGAGSNVRKVNQKSKLRIKQDQRTLKSGGTIKNLKQGDL